MAFRPSLRRSNRFEEVELNMFPMMNLMVVLVPLLLSTATAVKIGVIDLNLPAAIGGSGAESLPTEAQRSLDLTVTITAEGFYLASSQAVLANEKSGGGPTISKTDDGQYNYQRLSELLYQVKQKIVGSMQDSRRIIIQAEPAIEYQVLVSTMDAARSILINEQRLELFPEVSISTGIL